jgi:hypothetical protein
MPPLVPLTVNVYTPLAKGLAAARATVFPLLCVVFTENVLGDTVTPEGPVIVTSTVPFHLLPRTGSTVIGSCCELPGMISGACGFGSTKNCA